LVDIKNRPDPPNDFTLTSRFKCSETAPEFYRTMIAGMDGSPMESYYTKMTPDEGWDLVHFVRTLQLAHKDAAPEAEAEK
jgi:hypothetical protein